MTEYSAGELVRIGRSNNMTLCHVAESRDFYTLKEIPVTDYEIYCQGENNFTTIEGKVGLVVYVSRNSLGQPLGYKILIDGKEMFCKAMVAHKHFNAVETANNESGRSSKI